MAKLFKKNKKSAIAQESPSIATQSTSKKISFFSAMLIVMGSSIGAGIFFKAKGVLESSQGSLVFAILAWLIAAFAVIAMALALMEIASARNDNLSLIGWCKVFNSRTIYKASKNFMFYIYLPLTYFFMPFYVIMSLQDAIGAFGNSSNSIAGGKADWVIWFIISLAISFYFIFVSGMSSRAGNIMNKGILAVKFIPLVATIVLGFVIVAIQGAHVSANPLPTNELGGLNSTISSKYNPTEFGFMSPAIGLFMAIGAIFFAYDGFYVTAGIQSEMKEPKKTPLAIVLGLGAVTIIYLAIAISMSLTGNGGLTGFQDFLITNKVLWIFGVLNLTIAIGVLGIINGFAMWAPRFVEDLIKENELPFSQRFKNKLNANKPMVGIWYSVIITVPIVVTFTIIGAYAYQGQGLLNTYGKIEDGVKVSFYGSVEMSGIYAFCDLTGTWTAVFAFMFIMLPIFGGIKNRKQHFVKTEQQKSFVPLAWVSVIIIGIVLIFLFLDAFINVFMLINCAQPGWNDQFYNGPIGGNEGVISRAMKLAALCIFVALMLLPTVIEDRVHIKKYGSIEAYERALGIESTIKPKVAVY